MKKQNEQVLVDKSELDSMAREIDALTNGMEFMRSYLSLLSVKHRRQMDHESLMFLHISLFNDGALDQIDYTLEDTIKKVSGISLNLFAKSDSDE